MITIPILTVELVAAEERKEGNPMKKVSRFLALALRMTLLVCLLASCGGKSGSKYSTPASVVFNRRVNMMSDPKTRSQYLKKNRKYAMRNVNIFPSVNKLFYWTVMPTYYYNMLVMFIFMFICSAIAVFRVKCEK